MTLMSPSLSALDVAEDGTMKMSSSALAAADEDVDESVVGGAGCGRGRNDAAVACGNLVVFACCVRRRAMAFASDGDGLYVRQMATALVCVGWRWLSWASVAMA